MGSCRYCGQRCSSLALGRMAHRAEQGKEIPERCILPDTDAGGAAQVHRACAVPHGLQVRPSATKSHSSMNAVDLQKVDATWVYLHETRNLLWPHTCCFCKHAALAGTSLSGK